MCVWICQQLFVSSCVNLGASACRLGRSLLAAQGHCVPFCGGYSWSKAGTGCLGRTWRQFDQAVEERDGLKVWQAAECWHPINKAIVNAKFFPYCGSPPLLKGARIIESFVARGKKPLASKHSPFNWWPTCFKIGGPLASKHSPFSWWPTC